MKRDILFSIRKRHFLTIVYTAFFPLLITSGGAVILCIISLAEQRLASLSFIWFFSALFAGIVLLFFLFRYLNREKTRETKKVEPYTLQLDCCKSVQIMDALIQRFAMQILPTGNFYSYVKGKRNILFLLYRMGAFNKKEFTNMREKSTRAARKLIGLKAEMPIAEIKNSCRINLLLLDSITEEARKQMSVNAVYGMRYAEAVLNVYIDTKMSTLYIPSYVSLWNGGSSAYYFCVKELLNKICG